MITNGERFSIAHARVGQAVDSFVSSGAVISGGRVERSILSPWVTVHSWAEVTGSVLMHNVVVGRNAIVRNAILDKNVVVPPGVQIGVDHDADRAAGYVVDDGITVLAKEQKVQG